MFTLSLLLILFSVRTGFAVKFCANQNPCKCESERGVIDLTSIGTTETPRFHDVFFPEDNCTEFYSYNPCFPFHYDTADVVVKEGYKPCIEAAACIKKPGLNIGHPPEEHAIGLQDSAVFYNDTRGPYINYSVPNSKAKRLQVYLTCDMSVEYSLSMIMSECEDKTSIVLNLTSKCCCPNACLSSSKDSSGLSTGSVLLIVFFTVLIAYLLVGIVWNFCNGAHGAELIPNQEFWNDLPTLIMEGVIFTCSCFPGRTYGEV